MSLRHKVARRLAPPPPPAPPPPAVSPPPPAHEPCVKAVTRRPQPFAMDPPGPASSMLYERIAPGDLAILEEKIAASPEPPIRELWESAEPHQKPRLAVLFGVYFQLPGVLEATGLLPDMPPDEVHAMARGPIAAGGDLYITDIVLSYLQEAGMAPAHGERVLDFGCSSGRVLRVLGALRPDLELLGCAPNEGAIAWANEHLPRGRFFVSPTEPPLDVEDASLDGAFAISIWSHFDAGPALAWLGELRPRLNPGAGGGGGDAPRHQARRLAADHHARPRCRRVPDARRPHDARVGRRRHRAPRLRQPPLPRRVRRGGRLGRQGRGLGQHVPHARLARAQDHARVVGAPGQAGGAGQRPGHHRAGAPPVSDLEQRSEVEALRARVAELEAQLARQAQETAALIAEAQEKLYWLERWHID